MKKTIILFLCLGQFVLSQDPGIEQTISRIYTASLEQGASYQWLDHLSNQIGGRLSGSLNAERAVEWGKETLEGLDLDRVWLQKVMVPKWVRGTFEYANIETSPGNTINVPVCALGGSIATPASGIRATVVEVQSFKELEELGEAGVKGKIVFFNRPMAADNIHTFEAYSAAVNQRTQGAAQASKYGAVAAIVRSLNLRLDDFPHTGSTRYDGIPLSQRIPAAAISTNGAELLSSMLKLNPNLKFFLKQNCKNYPDVLSYNVIGEIKGTKFPEQIMVVGGHLDSWDLGDGSHDDGAGIVQSMEVLRLFKKLKIQPKRTLRVVLYMNEENGMRGGKKYASEAFRMQTPHYFALESDAGGFTPRGFSFDCTTAQYEQMRLWFDYLAPYQIHEFSRGGSGADIGPLKDGRVVLAGLRPDSQRYFDYHHAANDTFDAINKRELELGAAAMASLVYLMDQFDVSSPN